MGMQLTLLILGQCYGGFCRGFGLHSYGKSFGRREEITEAILEGNGKNDRKNHTLGTEFLYVADTLEYQGSKVLVTRVALEIDKLQMINDFVVKASLTNPFRPCCRSNYCDSLYKYLMKPNQ